MPARRPRPVGGEADALQEETGQHWRGAAGYGSKRLHTDRGDNVGNHHLAAGACRNLRRPTRGAPRKAGGRERVGRMSPYERRGPGNAGRGDARRLPGSGNAWPRQRGSRQVAGDVPGMCLDAEPGSTWTLRRRRRAEGITGPTRGGCGQALKPLAAREGPSGKAAAANRTRESRPSGMRGGLVETWSRVELGTRVAIERAAVGHSPPKDARATLLPDNEEFGPGP
jgi:hypothetical protein